MTVWGVLIGPHRARAQQVGLFRYGLIQDALDPALSTKQRGRLVRAVAAATHPGPFGLPVQISRASLNRWIRDYRRGGFTALVPTPRRVAAQTPTSVLELAVALKTERPDRTAAQVAVVLAAHSGFSPSARTLQRHFAAVRSGRSVFSATANSSTDVGVCAATRRGVGTNAVNPPRR